MKKTALQHYERLIRLVDDFEARVSGRYGESMACRKGCGSCCILQSVSAVEAFVLSAALDRLLLDQKTIVRGNGRNPIDGESPCVFLHEDACLVYAHRPVICRTHGLPLLVEGRIDHCPLNFTGTAPVEGNFVLNLENLNTMLSAVNLLFLKETGEEFFRRERVPLRDIALRPNV